METLTERTTAAVDTAVPSSAFAQAYTELSPAVLGYLRARGVDDPEAVTQDVFMALYPRMSSVTGGSAGLRTLVFSIAHARSVDFHRRQGRQPNTVQHDPAADPRVTESAEEQAIARGVGGYARELLESLSEDQREILTLRVVADMSLEDTAAVTGKTVGAVKQLQRRALTGLRNRLSKKGEGER
ncbi:RNA polymerase sigma factor [Arthrobacter sp. M4]|uniref:RNA polymerase sigma factor n=1 Tax=Arthrobacter sp. M4 TaxID=218160 RepID=UPI001CDBD5A5|nr:sigma-70 family RNA polymerase sigma factor [Arthrobacter sp. M4]MCA4135028.1 sigma-70 family RNA polymerase sigma factor [Arthrobacter sp. M4]